MHGGIFIVIVLIIIAIVSEIVKKHKEINKASTKDMSKHEWRDTSSMKHIDCDISATSCLHEEKVSRDEKVCRRCGYKNEKGKRKCSLCGHRLW